MDVKEMAERSGLRREVRPERLADGLLLEIRLRVASGMSEETCEGTSTWHRTAARGPVEGGVPSPRPAVEGVLVRGLGCQRFAVPRVRPGPADEGRPPARPDVAARPVQAVAPSRRPDLPRQVTVEIRPRVPVAPPGALARPGDDFGPVGGSARPGRDGVIEGSRRGLSDRESPPVSRP